jgi:hypothetical protein
MRANLDQITGSLAQLRGGSGADRDNQRRSVLIALAQNNCGPQYASMLQQQPGPGGFLNNLFGGNNNPNTPNADVGPQSGTYRTVCVRTCDGAYFPISFATVPQRFADDERTCKAECPATDAALYAYRNPGEDMNQAVSTSGAPYSALPNAFRYRQEFTPTCACKAECPASDAALYAYRNPGEDINQAVSISGQPYTALPNAFHYRTEFNPSCSCKAAGQTWSDALKSIDDTAAAQQQGDIIVTEESAKKMSQPPTKGAPPAKKGIAPSPGAAAPVPTASTPPPDSTAATSDKPIRSVGPTFIPAK